DVGDELLEAPLASRLVARRRVVFRQRRRLVGRLRFRLLRLFAAVLVDLVHTPRVPPAAPFARWGSCPAGTRSGPGRPAVLHSVAHEGDERARGGGAGAGGRRAARRAPAARQLALPDRLLRHLPRRAQLPVAAFSVALPL